MEALVRAQHERALHVVSQWASEGRKEGRKEGHLDTRTHRHQSTSVYTGRDPEVRPQRPHAEPMWLQSEKMRSTAAEEGAIERKTRVRRAQAGSLGAQLIAACKAQLICGLEPYELACQLAWRRASRTDVGAPSAPQRPPASSWQGGAKHGPTARNLSYFDTNDPNCDNDHTVEPTSRQNVFATGPCPNFGGGGRNAGQGQRTAHGTYIRRVVDG